MTIVRWEPFREMENFVNRMMPADIARPSRGFAGTEAVWSPAADISETDAEYLVRADLPSIRREDVKVMVEQGVLTISGARKYEAEKKEEKFHRVESFQGTFTRSFSLPANVDEAAIRAESKDGVLLVHLPKTKAEKPKSIEIKVQ